MFIIVGIVVVYNMVVVDSSIYVVVYIRSTGLVQIKPREGF